MTPPQLDDPRSPEPGHEPGVRRRTRLLVLVAGMVGLYFLVPVERGQGWATPLRATGSVAVLTALTVGAVVQVRRASGEQRQVDGLVGAIVGVLTLFALTFYALEVHRPGQVDGLTTRVDALYFSASTMLTIGYGDVHAVGQAARVVALVQMAFDVLVVATAAGLLGSRLRHAAEERAHARTQGRGHRGRRLRTGSPRHRRH